MSPEAHWRSTVIPGTVTGSPARRAACRARFIPWLPCCRAAPRMTSSISPGPSPARWTACLMAWPARVWAGVSLKAPL